MMEWLMSRWWRLWSPPEDVLVLARLWDVVPSLRWISPVLAILWRIIHIIAFPKANNVYFPLFGMVLFGMGLGHNYCCISWCWCPRLFCLFDELDLRTKATPPLCSIVVVIVCLALLVSFACCLRLLRWISMSLEFLQRSLKPSKVWTMRAVKRPYQKL